MIPLNSLSKRIIAGRIITDAEYIGSVDDIDEGRAENVGASPSAWNIEMAFTFPDRDAEIAIKHEGTHSISDLPESQNGTALSIAVFESSALAIEYLYGEFPDDTGQRSVFTMQFATEF